MIPSFPLSAMMRLNPSQLLTSSFHRPHPTFDRSRFIEVRIRSLPFHRPPLQHHHGDPPNPPPQIEWRPQNRSIPFVSLIGGDSSRTVNWMNSLNTSFIHSFIDLSIFNYFDVFFFHIH